jgi:hypothetical protein
MSMFPQEGIFRFNRQQHGAVHKLQCQLASHIRPELASPTPLPIGTPLAEYRAYLIGDDGHFYDVFHLTCADDAEAIEMAKKLVVSA